MTLGAEREEPRHVWGHATLEVLPGGAAVEAGAHRATSRSVRLLALGLGRLTTSVNPIPKSSSRRSSSEPSDAIPSAFRIGAARRDAENAGQKRLLGLEK